MNEPLTLAIDVNVAPNNNSVRFAPLEPGSGFEQEIPSEVSTRKELPLEIENETEKMKRAVRYSLPERINLGDPESQVFAFKKWEGTVSRKKADSFVAQLRDLLDPDAPEDEAEFLLSDVSEDDLPLIEEGAFFIFSVGQEVDRSRNVRRVTNLYFRRMPRWSPNAILSARERAAVLEKRLSDGSSV